jgi:hypothetical protein
MWLLLMGMVWFVGAIIVWYERHSPWRTPNEKMNESNVGVIVNFLPEFVVLFDRCPLIGGSVSRPSKSVPVRRIHTLFYFSLSFAT